MSCVGIKSIKITQSALFWHCLGTVLGPYGSQEARRCWNQIDKNHSNTKSALNRVGFARGYGFGAVVVFLRGKTNEWCFYVEKSK